MPLYGRRDNPGERGVRGVLDQRSVLNRTIRAQVSAVNPTDGYVILTFESMPSGGRYATVPPLWMSFPDAATNSGPAWGRYMPQQSDLVKVSFDYDDSPHIVGFDIVANKHNVADGRAGWPQLNEQHEAGKNSSDAKKAKFAQFIPLNPGEYDFMSSGGAYIYGNNRGRLYLAGGSVSVSLIKNDLRISQRAQLWTHIADDCEFRFGQVRRVISSDQLDKAIGDGKSKEFNVSLKTTTAPGVALNLSSFKIGNVRDNTTGEEELSPNGSQAMRFSYKAFNDAGVEALHMAIDKIGNWDVIAPTATKGVKFDFSASDWFTTFKSMDHTASVSFKLTSPSQTFDATGSFTVNSPNVSLGTGAAHRTIMSTPYRAAESLFATNLSTQVSILAGAVSSLALAVKAFCSVTASAGAGMAVPIVGAVIGGPLIGTAAEILSAAALAASSTALSAGVAAVGAANTFISGYDSYLSTIVKNA